MIKGLFETHLFVKDLERSIAFYNDILGVEQCYFEADRRAAFFWIGLPQGRTQQTFLCPTGMPKGILKNGIRKMTLG